MKPRCDSISDSLTAWIDGELAASDERVVARHVADCSSCADEVQRLRQTIRWQTETLPTRLLESPVDVAALRMGVRRQLNAARRPQEQPAPRAWTWLLRPLAVASAGLAVALVVVVWRATQPEPLLVSLGVEAPPPAVATVPDKFQYLEVIENLEALEHFEAVQAVRLEDERAHLDAVRSG
jgi:anti-sigma factor RsiW